MIENLAASNRLHDGIQTSAVKEYDYTDLYKPTVTQVTNSSTLESAYRRSLPTKILGNPVGNKQLIGGGQSAGGYRHSRHYLTTDVNNMRVRVEISIQSPSIELDAINNFQQELEAVRPGTVEFELISKRGIVSVTALEPFPDWGELTIPSTVLSLGASAANGSLDTITAAGPIQEISSNPLTDSADIILSALQSV